jgi:flagellar protein FlaG
MLPMMEMDTRVWCGACRLRGLRSGNGTRDMYEPTTTQPVGSDVAWTHRRVAADAAATPRPDAVRPEAATAHGTAPGTPATPNPQDDATRTTETRDAVFPTSYARFSIDSETQRLSIKIVDAVTDEVIREIPNEQVQRMAHELQAAARRSSIGKRPTGASYADAVANGGVDRYV